MKQTSKNGLNHSCQSWPRNIMHHSQLIFNPLRIISSLMICPQTLQQIHHTRSLFIQYRTPVALIGSPRSGPPHAEWRFTCVLLNTCDILSDTRDEQMLSCDSLSAQVFTCEGEIFKHNHRQQQRLVSKLYSETINKASVNECCLNVEVVCGGKTAAMSENGTKRNSMMS